MTVIEKIAEEYTVRGPSVININIIGDSVSSSASSSDSLKSYADEVDRIASQDRERTGVDEYTEARIKLHLKHLKELVYKARSTTMATEVTRNEVADAQSETLSKAVNNKEKAMNAIVKTMRPNKYVEQSRFKNKGLLGTMAEPNDGSGTSMIARKELMNRLLSKSMKNNSGDVELLKLRSQNPNQEYPGVEND